MDVRVGLWRRIGAFELWCWRRLLRVPWTASRSNLSILKEINPGISLEGMMLKLKLPNFGHLMQRVDSLENTLILGRVWGQEGKRTTEDEMSRWHHWLDGHEFEWTPGVDDGQAGHGLLQFMGSQRVMTKWLNWTELNCTCECMSYRVQLKSSRFRVLFCFCFFNWCSFVSYFFRRLNFWFFSL